MSIIRPWLTLVLLITISLSMLAGCAGTIIETATDATLAVAKLPFKAGGAIIDVIDGEEEED